MKTAIVSSSNTDLAKAQADLLKKIDDYVSNPGWHVQGGLSHTISRSSKDGTETHHLSVLLLVHKT